MSWRCGGGFGSPPLRRSICPVFPFYGFQRGLSLALGLKPPHGLCGRLRGLGDWAWSGLGCTLSEHGGLLLLMGQVPGAGDAGVVTDAFWDFSCWKIDSQEGWDKPEGWAQGRRIKDMWGKLSHFCLLFGGNGVFS